MSCGKDFSFEGSEHIPVYNSSEWAERGFCRNFGSNLFYRLKGSKELETAAGLFDDKGGFNFELQVFIDKKPFYYGVANITEEMTEQEVIDKYSPDQNT